MHRHTSHRDGSKRWFLNWGHNLDWGVRVEVSRRWRSGFIATFGYGGQEDFVEWTLALPRLFFLHIAFDTPFKGHRLRPFDGKSGESKAKFGLRQSGGDLYLLVGHDSMGTWYSTHGRGGAVGRWLRSIKRNKQVMLFSANWILGRAKYTREVLEQDIPVLVKVGQWDGDEYRGVAHKDRATWKRRFSTKVVESYGIDMQEGIPFPGKGENSWDCGDDAYFGFGGVTIEGAVAHIIEEVKKRRGKNWRPSGVPV